MVPASRAQSLPFDVVVPILSCVVDDTIEAEWTHGQDIGWEDHHAAAAATVVCQAWREPATTVLYSSVSIQGQRTAELFLATLHTRPELGAKVRWIVVGVGAQKENQQVVDDEITNASKRVVQVLAACPNLEHILLRPLHSSVRLALVDVLRRRAIKTLITRAVACDPPWAQGFFLEDFVLPTLRCLHIDWWRQHRLPTDDDIPLRDLSLTTPLPFLTYFETRSDAPLCMASAPSLRVFKAYTERLADPDLTASVLSLAINLRHLTFTSNPPLNVLETYDASVVPLINRILPHLNQLASLNVSATDVSTSFLRVAPASLTQVTIRALNWFGFAYDASFVADLRQPHLAVGLRELVVLDTVERWEEQQIDEVRLACEARGVRWKFSWEEYDDSKDDESEQDED